jgi:predicted membrane-bound mannosyltransferase
MHRLMPYQIRSEISHLAKFLVRNPLFLAVLGIAILALLLRIVNLGDRAMHHDESLHAEFAWRYLIGLGYQHDPMMHGPLLFNLIGVAFYLLGDSEFTARLPFALVGSCLVFCPLFFREKLGAVGVCVCAVLLSISPSLLYYSRFSRNDILVTLFTFLLVISIWKLIRPRTQPWFKQRNALAKLSVWHVMFVVALSGLFLTKELSYMIVALLLLYLNFALAHEWTMQRHNNRPTLADRIKDGIWLIPASWILASIWPLLGRTRYKLGLRSRPEADILILLGTLVLPLLGAAVRIVQPELSETLIWPVVGVLFIAALVVGLAWNAWVWICCAMIFYALLLLLYTTFGLNLEGARSLFWDSLSYWIDQQEVKRGTQPWFYYLMLIPLYEFLTLIPALFGTIYVALTRKINGFLGLLLVWTFGMFVGLTFAGEKMPWLSTHIALPLTLLASYYVARFVRIDFRLTRARKIAAVMAGVPVIFAVCLTAWTNVGLNIRHSDTPLEPMIYTQTSPDVPRLASRITQSLESGSSTGVVLDTDLALSWPWAWYLRGRNVDYTPGTELQSGDYEMDPKKIAILTDLSNYQRYDLMKDHGLVEPYMHRWWFNESDYRQVTWQQIFGTNNWPDRVRRLGSFLRFRGETPHGVKAFIGFPK